MSQHARKLAVIMFTDIVGYTAMMGSDESAAIEILRQNREIHQSFIHKFGGQLLKEMGDGILASFESSSQAVGCASAIQSEASKRSIALRIGLHQGEVIVERGDIFGDGVNVASRIEQICQPGMVYLSEAVYREIQNKPAFQTTHVGEFELKNVESNWHIYSVLTDLDLLLDEIGLRADKKEVQPVGGVSNFAQRLWSARIPQALLGYIFICWLMRMGLRHTLHQLDWSPHWADIFGVLALAMLPAALLYLFARQSQQSQATMLRRAMLTSATVGILAAVLLFGGKDLGATTTFANVTDRDGQSRQELIVKPAFREKVAIFDFAAESPDSANSWLGSAIAQALNLDLDQDKHVVAGGLGYLPTARQRIEHAQQSNFKWILLGSYAWRDSFELSVQLYDAGTGRLRNQTSVRAEALLDAIDKLSPIVKKWIGLSEEQIRQSVDLDISDFGTDQLEAIRYTTLAVSGQQSLYNFDRALEIDSTFAIASSAKASWLHKYQLSDLEARRTIALAMRHRERLPLEWDLQVRAFYFQLNDQLSAAAEVINMQLELDPGNIDLLEQLSDIYWTSGQVDLLPDVAERIYAMDPTSSGAVVLTRAYLINDQIDRATKTIDRFVRSHPGDVFGLYTQGICQMHAGNFEQAKASLTKIFLHQPELATFIDPMLNALDYMHSHSIDPSITQKLVGHYRHFDLEMTFEVRFFGNHLYARADNQVGYYFYPVDTFTYIMSGPTRENDRWHFIADDSGIPYKVEITEINGEHVSEYFLWKQDSIILSAERMLRRKEYEVAREKYSRAMAMHPNHYYLKTFARHIEYMLDNPDVQTELQRSIGKFGPRTIWMEDGQLYYKRRGWPLKQLLPLGNGRFAMSSTYDYLMEVVQDNGKVVGTTSWRYDESVGDFVRDESDYIPKDDG